VEYDRLSLNPFLWSYTGMTSCSNKAILCLVSKFSKSRCSLQTVTLLKVEVGTMFYSTQCYTARYKGKATDGSTVLSRNVATESDCVLGPHMINNSATLHMWGCLIGREVPAYQ